MRVPTPPPSQIALPLVAGRSGEAQRIVIGNANAHVLAALRQPDSWPFRVAVITGPPRSGKSLLARWVQREDQGGMIDVIDDAQALDEAKLFHRWNAVQEAGSNAGRALLLFATVGTEGWTIRLPDLASRLGGSLQSAITEPDDAMAAELIEAHAEARRISLPEGAGNYLAARTTRSFSAIEALVAAIDRISLERQTPATMSVLRAALEALHGPEQQRLL